jgi:hypothetical protein
MDPQERAELIVALHQITRFADTLLGVNERLVKVLSGEGTPPTEADLAYLREGLARWRGQLEGVRQRLAGLLVEPPERPQ